MRFFVASWFFPPSTSSEGIVSYKLFRNSRHTYDVCSSQSSLWSYDQVLNVEAENIAVYPIDTDDLSTWVSRAVALFEEKNADEPYDAIMTRSMPPESIEVAKQIKAKHPDIPWVASLADPIAKSPYDIKSWVIESDELNEQEKIDFQVALAAGCDSWKAHASEGIRTMCALKDIEDYAVNNADALIFPHDTPKNYILGTRRRKNAFSVPHSFDKALYPEPKSTASDSAQKQEAKTLAFIGHSDVVRSLEPVVRAVNHLRLNDEAALNNLKIRFVGNVPEHIRSLVYNYYLYDYISIEPSVDYRTSLAIMEESDWLIHIDANFDFLPETGGSIYFAGKLADYMGTDAPILAVTGKHSPAYEMVRRAGGVCVEQDDIAGIAEILADISYDSLNVVANRDFRDTYSAQQVAARYDDMMDCSIGSSNKAFSRTVWPQVPHENSCTEKFLSICVPAYNVECYLDRCLLSLVSCEVADKLDIIVVNDGSPDSSREIALAYQERYPSIVRLIDKENGGHGSTINAALAQARGIYFRVIDGDDWVDGKNLSKLVSTIEERNLFADLVSTNYHQVYGEDGHTVPWMKVSAAKDYTVFNFAQEDFTMEYFTMASTMVKTDLLRSANFKIQEHTYYVDVEFILFPIPFVETVMFTPEYVYRYAVGNADQSINPDNFVRKYDHHDRVIRRMVSYYAEKKPSMGKGQAEYMKSLFIRHLLKSHYTLSLVWDSDKERGFARAKDFDEFLRAQAPDLHEACVNRYNGIKVAEKAGFDPKKTGDICSLEESSREALKQNLKKTAKALSGNKVGDKLVHNRCTRAVARRLFH